MQRIPDVIYRLRSRDGLSLRAAAKLAEYLEEASISDLAVPPILTARPGSAGLALVDPTRVDDGLGGAGGLGALVSALRPRELGLQVDLVVDRMVATTDNPFFRELLLRGQASPCAAWFDVDWDREARGKHGRIVLPVLPIPYGEALRDGSIRVEFAPEGFVVRVAGLTLPIRLSSWHYLVGRRHAVLQAAFGSDHPAVAGLREVLLVSREDQMDRAGAARRLSALVDDFPPARVLVDEGIRAVTPPGVEAVYQLHELLEQQHYRLAWTECDASQVNYRVVSGDDALGARVEDRAALEGLHDDVLERVRRGDVTGLRVREADQVGEPSRLLRSLAAAAGDGAAPFVTVEKRGLGEGDRVPAEWETSGDDGGEFALAVTRLMIDRGGLSALSGAYERLPGRTPPHDVAAYRRDVLSGSLRGELERLLALVMHAASQDPDGRDLPAERVRAALVELTANVPVYRTYLGPGAVSAEDRAQVERGAELAAAAGADPRALEFLRALLLPDEADVDADGLAARVARRWQQTCAAATSRAWEEAARGSDLRLCALNDVGGIPSAAPDLLSIGSFHEFALDRVRRSPHAINATSVERSRLGEDVRARISALSEVAPDFVAAFRRLARRTRELKVMISRKLAPDAATEWLVYQLAIGGWPKDDSELEGFANRVAAAAVEAARESGARTSRAAPDEAFEAAVTGFVRRLLAGLEGAPFRKELKALRDRAAFLGHLGSLSQLVLKFFAPGVPEVEEGAEVLDLRIGGHAAGDAERARQVAGEVAAVEQAGDLGEARKEWLRSYRDGRLKAHLTRRAARVRRELPALFRDGEYVPCEVTGKHADRVCAFARRNGGQWALVAVGVGLAGIGKTNRVPAGTLWKDTRVLLPEGAPSTWSEALLGGEVSGEGSLACRDLFATVPQAVCVPV